MASASSGGSDTKLAIALLALVVLTAQAPRPSPFVSALDEIAQRQLKARASTIAGIKDTAAAQARNAAVRARVLSLLGGLPESGGPLNARVTKTTPRPGYVIEHVMFESLPGYVVTANLYRPERAGRHPAILMSMGHWDSGKGAGQLIASNLARRGFVVLAYDPVGQGERQQAHDPRFGRSLIGGPVEQHFVNGPAAILMGQAVSRYFIHDGMRAIDYLVTRPEVDPDRIGATGCSGGGTQTTYIAALDPRIKVAAVACYMNSFRTLFPGPSLGDSEQSVPGFIAAGLDQTDYVELFAPKPWLITSTEDDFFTPAGARQVFEEAQRWYELYDAADRVKWVVGPGGHGTPTVVRQAIYDWMVRWLKPAAGGATDEVTDLLPDQALFVTANGQVEGRGLYEIIKETPRSKGTPEELSAFVSRLMAENPPIGKASKILTPERAGDRHAAVVLVQDTLEQGADANALAGQRACRRADDDERQRTGRGPAIRRQLDEQHPRLAGREESPRDARRGDQRRRRGSPEAGRCRSVPHRGSGERCLRRSGTAGGSGQSADCLARALAHAAQRARRDRQPDSHQPARRRDSRVRREVGFRRPASPAPSAHGRMARPDRLDGQRGARRG